MFSKESFQHAARDLEAAIAAGVAQQFQQKFIVVATGTFYP